MTIHLEWAFPQIKEMPPVLYLLQVFTCPDGVLLKDLKLDTILERILLRGQTL
jgi:hypothetical protein